MISDIVSVVLVAIIAYFLVYGFYVTFTDLLKGGNE